MEGGSQEGGHVLDVCFLYLQVLVYCVYTSMLLHGICSDCSFTLSLPLFTLYVPLCASMCLSVASYLASFPVVRHDERRLDEKFPRRAWEKVNVHVQSTV